MRMIRIQIILVMTAATIGSVIGYLIGWWPTRTTRPLLSPLGNNTENERPLDRYAFEVLREKHFVPKPIRLVDPIATESAFTSWLFEFETEEGRVSGQMNVPKSDKRQATGDRQDIERITNNDSRITTFPVIVMLRGYVDKEIYETGVGTKNAAAVFARSGFLTLAPDFLGYGSSDPESIDEMEARLVRPATVLQLLSSLASFPYADPSKVFIWAHSNGGQIALSVLEITGRAIPTTLWAPVTRPFPYSILYYTDELDDHGKYLRRKIAEFEKIYDAEKFSITNYFDWIQAPIQIHQGTADDAVPKEWSDEFVKSMKDLDKNVDYSVYPGADHNMKPSWNTIIARDLEFFRKHLNARP